MPLPHEDLRTEADALLGGGLRTLLEQHGELHVVGSYALDLMTWRDLDLHLVQPTTDLRAFFALGGDLATLLQPHRMHFRDETGVGTPGLPRGVYWGIYLGDERQGAWKIDLWQTDRDAFEPVRRFGEAVASRLTRDTRAAIVAIKSACWRHPLYRREFGSADIYSAVLDHGIGDVHAFWTHLQQTKAIRE